MDKALISLLLIYLLSFTSSCVQLGQSNSDYQNALEAIIDGRRGSAMDYLDDQLKKDIYHIDARFIRAKILLEDGDYRQALFDVTFAIDNYNRRANVTESSLYALQGDIYIEDYNFKYAADSYKEAVKLALKDNPDKVHNYRFLLAQSLYFIDDYEGAEAVYNSMLEDNPEDYPAMVGLARNLRDQEKYEEALAILDEVEQLDSDYDAVYKFKMQIYDLMGRTFDSVDAALTYYDLDEEADLEIVTEYLVNEPSYAIERIRERIKEGYDTDRWSALLHSIYQVQKNISDAMFWNI